MVPTPSKWPGLAAPSSGSAGPSRWMVVVKPGGYISSTEGVKTQSTPSRSRSSRSADSERG